MKKYFILAIRYTFYIAALLFFKPDIQIIGIIFLISILFLENKYYAILPAILALYLQPIYLIIIAAAYLYHIILYKFFKRNRYYALTIFSVSILTANIILLINQSYTLNTLYVSLISLILYAIIECFYVFYKNGNKHLTIALNDNLIHLTILVGYLLLITFYNPLNILFYFLFMQLFIISNLYYNSLFFIIGVLLYLAVYKTINIDFTSFLATSFVPIAIIISLDFKYALSYIYLIYSILMSLLKITTKPITIENDYISNLFKDFNKYVNNLNIEYDRLNTLKEIKKQQIEAIENNFCANCKKDSLCRYKKDIRYSFLSQAISDPNYNIYGCPNAIKFYIDDSNISLTPLLQFNAITSLADELEFLYAQNIKMAKCYNKFIKDLTFYNYKIEKLDINLASKTIYFSLILKNNKPIIKELFLKIAYKSFHEILDIKVINENKNSVIYIYKKPKVKVEYESQILAKHNNIISGDNFYIKKDYNEEYTFALSDGMGSGHKAYKESSEALKLISNLSSYHFSLKTILKLLENFYDLKCDYDSYATLDILNLNTANMKMNLYKLGSTTSYIYHNNELQSLLNRALPLKLDDMNSAYELEFFKNDVIILMSDGISDFVPELQIKNEINFNNDAKKIMNDILQKLYQNTNNELKDDASIIVIKII